MTDKKVRKISFAVYAILVLCPLIATSLGFTFLPVKTTYADVLPLAVLQGLFVVWFAGIVAAFLLPIIKRVQEDKEKEVSNILFGSATLLVSALISVFLIGMSGFAYLFYIGLRMGTFHAIILQ